MEKVKALFSLTRPLTTFSGVLSTVMGGYVAGTGAWLHITLAAIATALITGAANAWNDYLDIEIDKVNQPQRVLPSGSVSPQTAWRFSLALTLLAILLPLLINLPTFLMALASSVLLYVYSWKLKSTVLVGNATVAGISALSVVFGGVAAGHVQPTLLLALIIGVAILGREVLKTMADYEGDLSQQCRTVATVWGKRVSRNIFFILATTTGIIMMVPYLLRVYSPVYAYIVAFGVYPVLLYILIRVARDTSARQLNFLSRLMKYDYFIWFLAVILGSVG
ncbi:MAG: geranylgeranylglycerol-phosphate geranylgeranyltransferase [Candidatus Promineifilaceae bacterium]